MSVTVTLAAGDEWIDKVQGGKFLKSHRSRPLEGLIAASLLTLLELLLPTGYACADAANRPKNAVDRSIAIYIPRHEVDSRIFLPQFGTTFAPGEALKQAALDVGALYFRDASAFAEADNRPFNVILALHGKWESKDRDSILTVHYKLLGSDGAALAEGTKSDDINTQKLLMSNDFYRVSLVVMKDIIADDELLAKVRGSGNDASTASAANFDRNLLVSRDKPASSGTGFFINDHGQLLTAAHVLHACPVPVVKIDDKSIDGKIVAESLLLDLAVVDTGGLTPAHVIPLRAGTTFELGEPVTNIGFPLNGLLTATPNVTRGNVSSRTALNGSIGQFQFSAPVQPGSSGGPVVSDAGEASGRDRRYARRRAPDPARHPAAKRQLRARCALRRELHAKEQGELRVGSAGPEIGWPLRHRHHHSCGRAASLL